MQEANGTTFGKLQRNRNNSKEDIDVFSYIYKKRAVLNLGSGWRDDAYF